MPQNLYDELWRSHVVHEEADGTALIYIDRHLVHEVTSPQAFEGLDKIFGAAGFEWRQAGCSMRLAMNADRLSGAERCALTSNCNFEGRQGAGGRAHLVSPERRFGRL